MPNKTEQSPKSAAPAAKDRRADPRYKFMAAAVAVEKKSGTQIDARVGDLSREGCFLETNIPFPLGAIVSIRITKGAKSFLAVARIVSSSAAKGMGLFFTTVDPPQREILTEWLAASLETSWLASTRRQSQRILIRIPIRVMGQNQRGTPLLLLSTSVSRGQHITLSNQRTKESLECVVAHIGETHDNLVQVGVAFLLPNPGFWGVTFPPEDWSVRHPDAKSSGRS